MSLAYNINAIGSSSSAVTDSKSLIPVSITEQHYEITNNKRKKSTERILLKLEKKPNVSMTREEIVRRFKENYNSLNKKEKKELLNFLSHFNNSSNDKGNIIDNNIQNIMMIISKVWGQNMQTQGIDEEQQANDIKLWQSFLDTAQKSLKNNFNKLGDLESKKAGAGKWWTYAIIVATVAACILIPMALELAPELMAVEAAEGGIEASTTSTVAMASDTGTVTAETNPVAIGGGDVRSADEIEAASQSTRTLEKTNWSRFKSFLNTCKKTRAGFRGLGKGLPMVLPAVMVPYMLISAIDPTAVPHPKGQVDQSKLEKAATKNQIVTNITNDMNNRIQTNAKRASDDSQNVQQSSGYVQQAINELGIAMSIRV
ncbi:MAG: hypothetical protein K1060chlam5_00389 [Candidatus Anoxychlamydiales bacterium]|nr:hypothetical protein [Candidatus Anoxychlamydiales bacterium]